MKIPFIYSHFYSFMIASLFVFAFAQCSEDEEDPEVPNEEEVITTLTLTFSQGNTVVAWYKFKDLDGDGGNDPQITSDKTLAPNQTYTAVIKLENETETPAEDITLEVKEEADEHQFFFDVESSLNLAVAYKDEDSKKRPLGVDTEWVTKDASTGKVKITLRHEPDKDADKVASGDITNAGGETDIEVTFNVEIK